jgi:hypothetical protein
VIGLLALAAALGALAWPGAAQSPTPPQADKWDQVDKRLTQIEKSLQQIQAQLKDMQPAKGAWQKLTEPGAKGTYIVMFNTDSGKVKYIDPANPQYVYEK